MKTTKFRAYFDEINTYIYGVTPYYDEDGKIEQIGFSDNKLKLPDGYIIVHDTFEAQIVRVDDENDIFDEIYSLLEGDDWFWSDVEDCRVSEFVCKDKDGNDVYSDDLLVDRWTNEDGKEELSHFPIVWNETNLKWCIDVSYSKNKSN